MPSSAEFLHLEQSIDAQVASLPTWSWPLKSVLYRIFMVANSLFGEPHAIRFGPARPEAGGAVIGRLSYLTPFLANCPRSGGGPEDALAKLDPKEVEAG